MKRALRNRSSLVLLTLATFWILVTPAFVTAQDTPSPLDSEGRLVRFSRDIAPIFAERCGECHLGDKPKADFLISDRESVASYITPGDAAESMLYADYLVAEDPDMLMPPGSHGGPMPASELALIRTWIEEGADWPEDAVVGDATTDDPEAEDGSDAAAGDEAEAASNPFLPEPYNRYWEFQGYFHPAVVHFPIALLSVGAMFVVLGVVWPKVGTQIPLACLLIGAASSIVACAMGWAFADEQGYPNYSAGWDKEITPHRWSGIIVAAVASVMSILAIFGVSKERRGLNFLWKTGLLALAVMVGLVGHQGGELTYGKEHYQKAFAKLQMPDAVAPDEAEDSQSSDEERETAKDTASGDTELEEGVSEEAEIAAPTAEAPPAPVSPTEETATESSAEETSSTTTPTESPASQGPVGENPAVEEPSGDVPVGT